MTCYEKWSLLVTVIGILVGMGVLVVYALQLQAMKASVVATQTAANAAKASADALVNSERAWVMTTVYWTADLPGAPAPTKLRIVDISGTGGEKTAIDVALTCKNEGKTPAWITEKRLWFGIFDELPSNPDTEKLPVFTYSGPEPLTVRQPSTNFVIAECAGKRPQLGGGGLVIYGVVKYRDVFGDHETWCGYAIVGDPPRLQRLAGYPEYNKNT